MDQSDLITKQGEPLTTEDLDLQLDESDLDRIQPIRQSPLFDLGQLDVRWDQELETLWTFMTPEGRPSFNLAMLRDYEIWQSEIPKLFGGDERSFKYLVIGSRFPGVWNFGGDLKLFADYIRQKDRAALVDYGRRCVAMLHKNFHCMDLPIVTIGLAQGQALGGGFEALLSFNVLIAERSAKFGTPEVAFGLFPGMGAHALIIRKLGQAKAEEMILGGKTYSAEEMQELGLVHHIVEDGEGEAAVKDFIKNNDRRHSGSSAVYRASREVNPLHLSELNAIVEIWADTALRLQEKDLRLMERLVSAQSKLSQKLTQG